MMRQGGNKQQNSFYAELAIKADIVRINSARVSGARKAAKTLVVALPLNPTRGLQTLIVDCGTYSRVA